MLDSALLEKAKKAKTKEELIALAKENSILLADEEVEYYLSLLNGSSIHGELGDDELEDVSGGCKTEEYGKRYTVVTSGTKCFNGKYEKIRGQYPPLHSSLRETWSNWSSDGCCGRCSHLGFKSNGLGFCWKS